ASGIWGKRAARRCPSRPWPIACAACKNWPRGCAETRTPEAEKRNAFTNTRRRSGMAAQGRFDCGGISLSLDVDNTGNRSRGAAVVVDLFDDVRPDLERVEQELYQRLHSERGFLRELATHLVRGGGKRLRPALVLQTARVRDYRPERVIPVAAAVEMIHMATLIHDDVVDGSDLRRGLPTVNRSEERRVGKAGRSRRLRGR